MLSPSSYLGVYLAPWRQDHAFNVPSLDHLLQRRLLIQSLLTTPRVLSQVWQLILHYTTTSMLIMFSYTHIWVIYIHVKYTSLFLILFSLFRNNAFILLLVLAVPPSSGGCTAVGNSSQQRQFSHHRLESSKHLWYCIWRCTEHMCQSGRWNQTLRLNNFCIRQYHMYLKLTMCGSLYYNFT